MKLIPRFVALFLTYFNKTINSFKKEHEKIFTIKNCIGYSCSSGFCEFAERTGNYFINDWYCKGF
ncbi:hypothetical protein MASR2M52_08720 [Pedobacter sp.]